MTTNSIFMVIVDLEGLRIDENDEISPFIFCKGIDKHIPHLYFCHNKELLDEFFDIGFLDNIQYAETDVNKDINIYIKTYGLLVLERLRKNPYLYYLLDELQITDNDVVKYTSVLYRYAMDISKALWLVKDNSVTPNSALTYFGSKVQNRYPESYNSCSLNYLATGEREDAYFSKEELSEASRWYPLILDNLSNGTVKDFNNGNPVFDNIPNLPSFHRALNFINYARKEKNISSKISVYIYILKCIFAVQKKKKKKVSERAAWFIGTSGEERLDIFETLKKSYRERSNYVHGSVIKQSETVVESRKEVVRKLDDIVRNLFKKILDEKYKFLNYDASRLTKIDEWFNKLVISGEEPDEIPWENKRSS